MSRVTDFYLTHLRRGYQLIGQRIGYIRVSSCGQNPDRQLEDLKVVRAFTDTASSKDTHRPELERLLAFVREGDTVVVHSMDRLARNLDDLRRIEAGEQKSKVARDMNIRRETVYQYLRTLE